jgi:hypothetical protein
LTARGLSQLRDLVTQVCHNQLVPKKIRKLLTSAFADSLASSHFQVVTIPGIGAANAVECTGGGSFSHGET